MNFLFTLSLYPKNESIMTIKDFFSFRKNRFFWLNILGMIAFVLLAIFGALKGLDYYTQHGESISVPNVKGMRPSEAELLLHHQGLEIAIIDSTYIPNMVPGSIVEQKPGTGAKVKQGRPVYVTINSGNVPKRTIPDIIDNCSLREAQAKISAAGFKLDENEYIKGEKDWVYGVKYEERDLTSGEKIPIGAVLKLVVGDDKLEETDSLSIDINAQPEEIATDESWF